MIAGFNRWSSARPWQTNLALSFLGFGLLLLTRQFISENDHFTMGFSGVSGWSAILYAAAVLLVLTQPVNRYTFGIIFTFAIAFRFITLFSDPFLSSDIYRYAWDGVVQHAHISPYRYVPGDPALTFLRAPNQDLFDNINRRDYAHTIYPPVAQFIFYLVTFLNPTVTAMKAAIILFEGLTVYALVKLLTAIGIRRERILLYAWCPLIVWEIGCSGHIDSAVMAFIALALLFRYRKQPIATGIFLGLATMVKFYPIVLLPALYRRRDYKMIAAMMSVILVGYACYASVGLRVFGFMGGYVQEEGIESGTRYFLFELAHHVVGLHHLPTTAYMVFTGGIFAALILWCWRTCCDPDRDTADLGQSRIFHLSADSNFLVPAAGLGFVLMLLFSPHYPWYIAWLVPFFTLLPDLALLAYISAMFYLCTTAIAVGFGPQQFLLNEILYGTVAVAFLLDIALRRWPIHRYLVVFSDRMQSSRKIRSA